MDRSCVSRSTAELPEWSNPVVSKSVVPLWGTEGSNPSPSSGESSANLTSSIRAPNLKRGHRRPTVAAGRIPVYNVSACAHGSTYSFTQGGRHARKRASHGAQESLRTTGTPPGRAFADARSVARAGAGAFRNLAAHHLQRVIR
jgi:hypothetical protein